MADLSLDKDMLLTRPLGPCIGLIAWSYPSAFLSGWVALWSDASFEGRGLYISSNLALRSERELEPELDVAGAARADERIAGGDVGCGAPAAERRAAIQLDALPHASL